MAGYILTSILSCANAEAPRRDRPRPPRISKGGYGWTAPVSIADCGERRGQRLFRERLMKGAEVAPARDDSFRRLGDLARLGLSGPGFASPADPAFATGQRGLGRTEG